MWLQEQPNGYVTWSTNVSVYGDKDGVLQLLLDKVVQQCCLEGEDWQILRRVSPTQSHQSKGAAKTAVSTVRSLARTFLAVIKDKIASSM